MANPSHSTALPDPRNPQDDAQPDSRGRGNDGGRVNPDDRLSQRLGFRVRALRKRRRLKQEDLAGLIDRSVEAVSAIERGRSMPGYVTLARLAWALDVSPNVLFDVPEDADMSPVRAGLMAGIADRLRGLDDRSLHLAHHVVDGLVAAGRAL